MKKVFSHREPLPYTIRFSRPGDDLVAYWEYTVRANNVSEAIMQAKIAAGRDKIPVLECNVEVK